MRLYNDVGKKLLCVIGLTILGIGFAQADTRGKLTGRILDQKNQPIIGANVLLIGTTIGASSDIDGYYVIINVPVGVYGVRFGSIGYQTKIIKEVHINAGQTTTLDVSIAEVLIESQEVTVVAERPLVDTRQTSSVAILGKDDINVMPVQSLNDIVSIQAGVVDGHFRGGRAGEVQYQVDGVSVNNPYDNSSVVQLDKSVLQEVQVISGTFDAEYGQAMSGVVNAVLRSGSEEKYEYNAELYGGDYVSTGKRVYPYIERMDPLNIQSQTFSISGPVPIVDRTSFLMNVRHYSDKGYLYGEDRKSVV